MCTGDKQQQYLPARLSDRTLSVPKGGMLCAIAPSAQVLEKDWQKW